MPKRISITASTYGVDFRQSTATARKAGFAGLLLDSSFDVTSLSATGRREVRQILATYEQVMVGLDLQLGPSGLGPGADVDRILSRLSKLFDAAVGLGGPMVCVDVGRLPEPAKVAPVRPAPTPDQLGLLIMPTVAPPVTQTPTTPPPDPAFVSAVDQAAAAVGELADRHSVTVAIRSTLSSYSAVARLLSSVRCPWFGVDLDPISILRDDWSRDAIFSALGSSLLHVRGRDAVLGTDRRTQPAVVGRGSMAWGELTADLDAAGFNGWITIDPSDLTDRPRGAAAGLATLKS